MVKVGIIGCGRITEAHLKALLSLDNKFQIGGIYDTDTQKLREVSNKFSVKAVYRIEDLLTDDRVNLISVAVPDGLHYEVAKKAILHRKNVLIEKPIALSKEEAVDLLKLAGKQNVFLGVVLQKRLFKVFKKAKEMIDSGKIGDVFLVSLQQIWYRNNRYFNNSWHGKKLLDGGLILNQSAHNIDLIDWISGPIKKVFAYGGVMVRNDIETEDSVAVIFETEKSVGNMMLTISSFPENYGELFEFIGTKGRILIGTGKFMCITSEEFRSYFEELNRSTLSGYGHKLVYDEVYNRIVNKNYTVIDIQNALHSFFVGLSIRDSIEKKEEVKIGGKDGNK